MINKTIYVTPHGRFANRMIAYIAALNLAERLNIENVRCELPEWGKDLDAETLAYVKDQSYTLTVRDQDLSDISDIEKIIAGKRYNNLVLDGFFQRINLLGVTERIDAAFAKQGSPSDIISNDEIVINIRAADITRGVAWYPLAPPSYFAYVVKETGLRPVLVGQVDDTRYCQKIRELLPQARVINTGNPISDFEVVRSARHICLCVSTFPWLAAWLSSATTIHYPILGFLNPHCLSRGAHGLGGVNLLPLNDQRYRFYLFPELVGTSEETYLPYIEEIDDLFRPVSSIWLKRNGYEHATSDAKPSIGFGAWSYSEFGIPR